MNQYQVTTRARHLRYLCFVDGEYSYAALFSLMVNCLRKWGGRYIPIVPVYDNAITENYLELLKHYDPDYVLYSAGVAEEVLKKLRLFNPLGYFALDNSGHSNEFSGVYALHLLSEFDQDSKVLVSAGLSNLESPLLDFYKLNFGLVTATYMGDDAIMKRFQKIEINAESFAALNEIIHRQQPILRSRLARRNPNTPILRAAPYQPYDITELVIARDKESTLDLLYFWNRQLFECKNVLYCTADELTRLCQDQFFGGVLYDLSSYDHSIQVVSQTLSQAEVESLLVDVLRPIAFHRTFQYRATPVFPFGIQDAHGHTNQESNEKTTIQTLVSENGLLQLPLPSFFAHLSPHAEKWAVDLGISRNTSDYRNRLMFPLTTDSGFIVKQYKGRANLGRELSIVVPGSMNSGLDATVEIPSFPKLLRQLVMMPVVHGTMTRSRFQDLGPHDSSNRLAAFLRIFNNDFSLVEEFFADKFWVDSFEQLCISEKVAGEAIAFDEIVATCIAILRQRGVELGPREATFQNEANLRLGLRRTVQELCGYRTLLPGFKLKCTHCASTFWYPIKSANEVVNCTGCLEDFAFPIEQPFAYKLNNVIRNNIFQSKTQRDGNLTVIRTLASLHARARHSSGYSPQVNLYEDLTTNRPGAELDIAALVDGLFVIGEAKHSSAAFFQDNRKSLLSLVEVAKEVYPDQIILACYEDSHGKLARAEQFLAHHFNGWEYKPEIKTLLISSPDYFNLTGYRYFYH